MSLLNSNSRKYLLIAVALAGLISVASGLISGLRYGGDMTFRYVTARVMLHGENPYRMRVDNQYSDYARTVATETSSALMTDYFPSTLLPVLPLVWLPLPAYKVAWLALTLGCASLLARSLWWLAGRSPPPVWAYALVIGLWFAGSGFRSTLNVGQNTIFSLALIVAAICCLKQEQPWRAGILLALGVFKYTLVWPLVLFYFVLGRAWRSLFLAGGIHLIVHLLLCWRMDAGPVEVLQQTLQDNSRVFQRDMTLTIWSLFRTVEPFALQFQVRPDLLAGAALAGIVIALAWVWQQRKDNPTPLAWISLLSLLAVITVTTRQYTFIFFLANALWVLSIAPGEAISGQRKRLLFYLFYLGVLHLPVGGRLFRLIWPGDENQFLFERWVFNPMLLLLCIESAWLFIRELRRSKERLGNETPVLPAV